MEKDVFKKKLRIQKDSLRELSLTDIAQVAGGADSTDKTSNSGQCCNPGDPSISCQPTPTEENKG